LTVKADITVEKDVENLDVEIQKVFGRHADVLLNNAGYLDDGKLLSEQRADEWWMGFVSCMWLFLPHPAIQHLYVEDKCAGKSNDSGK